MVYDFYGKFSEIYPINLEDLKSPEREKWGYFWDMEDYMFKDKNGRGLLLQGILLNTPEDFNTFTKIFNYNLRKTTFNSLIKITESLLDNGSEIGLQDEDFSESVEYAAFKNFCDEFHRVNDQKKSYFESLNLSIRRGKIWISLNHYWTDLIKKETEDFWGSEIRVFRLPDSYSVMNRKDLWEETIMEGIREFDENKIWEDFSYKFPILVKHMDPAIRQKIGVNFLTKATDWGLF